MLTSSVRLLVLLVLSAVALRAADSPWPLDIPVTTGVVTLYQPQPERLEGTTLTGRAAVSYLGTGTAEDERVFGAVWFTALLDIDREHDVAKARQMTITKVITPKGEKTGDSGDALKKAIQDAVIAQGLELDLDRLITTLEDPADDRGQAINPAVPRILIRTTPALLLLLDGEPELRASDGLQRVVNSPTFLAVEGGTWWLRTASDWLTAPSVDGPWALAATEVTDKLQSAAKKAGFSTSVARAGTATAPEVIVARQPAELVTFTGQPAFAPVTDDGSLLGATNSDTTALVEVATGAQWLLLAGRWYTADRLADEATWTLVPPAELPALFAQIPPRSQWQGARANVPGTPEAQQAVIQQQIPQTARIPRTATITVGFDGNPRWVQVTGRSVEYAENSADAVFRLPGPTYYACRDGVWYTSATPTAPFAVATSVPEALCDLPADCPWSNVSYVQVYDSTPDHVWCGYTAGYLGWYTWHGCPIYGTGYPYHGWYGPTLYYPRPVTWGVGIRYNPYTGWGVAVGVSGSHWAVGISNGGGYRGWYGCGGVNQVTVNHTTTVLVADRDRATTLPAQRAAVYDRVPGAERPKLQASGVRLREGVPTEAAAPVMRRDNLAVDCNGTIGRPRSDGSWQTRDNGSWKDRPAAPVQKPANVPAATAKPAQSRPAPSFERTQQMRASGEQRVQQRSAPTARPAGGGGGRRR